MAEGDTIVASIILRRSYLKKLVFPKAVMQTRRHLLPGTLWGQTGKAYAILKGGNRETLPVTFSLGRKRDRLVLLGSGWKKVVKKLGLKEGEKVIISLDDRASSTYSICSSSLQSGHKPHVIMKFDLNKPPEESDEEEMDVRSNN
ncbi:hypothetical protein SLEP1_g13640 [Rubroshorea leprosula]|uniref:TF-B3 domain-containing protein n=1 Tax=Rubroshorea leprosula TaxID=152421 RepID=A0AAV5IGK1_9ROSI|nr:hypothetical protein SLEP1_g13640 [Rubroshorea leprosula]